jgi:MFS family permease
VFSFPVGVLADRYGSLTILVFGYGLGALTAILTALAFWFKADNLIMFAGIFFVAGLYVATQEALESTVTADMVKRDTLAMSIGALGTVNGVAKFISSTAVGVFWTVISPLFSFALAAVLMFAGTLALARLRGHDGHAT